MYKIRFGKQVLKVGDQIYFTNLDDLWNNTLQTVKRIELRPNDKVLRITTYSKDQGENTWTCMDFRFFKAKIKKQVKPINRLPKWW